MGRPIDDLSVGMWIVVTDRVEESPIDGSFFPTRRISFRGVPVRIVAISPPFIAVEDGDQTHSLDSREWGVNRVTNKRYIEAMKNYGQRDVGRARVRKEKKRRRQEEQDPRRCPRCGNRLVTRLMKVKNKHGWLTFCEECHLQGEFQPCE